MNKDSLIKYLLASSTSNNSVIDPYWNDVILLLRLDVESNSKGLPFYKDYSKYQYFTRYMEGSDTSESGYLRSIINGNTSFPIIPTVGNIDVDSFAYISNLSARNQKISDINNEVLSTAKASYIEIIPQGNPGHELGTSDFTLEVSFYVDAINLPWRLQSIVSAGQCVNTGYFDNDLITPNNVGTSNYLAFNANSEGYGLFVQDDDLLFHANGTSYSIKQNILADTWYHCTIVRKGNVLTTFINNTITNTYSFNKNLLLPTQDKSKVLVIGNTYKTNGSDFIRYSTKIETSFSGGLSNIRLTKAARYTSSFYTGILPHPVYPQNNKIDSQYSSVLFNIPCTYDYYDYSPNGAHFTDSNLLKTIPRIAEHCLALTQSKTYSTKTIPASLGNSWCLEFYLVPYVNDLPLNILETQVEGAASYEYNAIGSLTFLDLLFNKLQLDSIRGNNYSEVIPLIRLTDSLNNKMLDIDMAIVKAYGGGNSETVRGTYFYSRYSTDGENWLELTSEQNQILANVPLVTLPNDEIKFAGQFSTSNNDIEPDTTLLKGGFDNKRYHLAIQKINGNLHILINGVLHRTIPVPPLFSSTDLKMEIGGDNAGIQGKYAYYVLQDDNTYLYTQPLVKFNLGISGVKLTNAARYNIAASNDIEYLHSLQPLPLSSTALPPSRARVIGLFRSTNNINTSNQSIKWSVYVNQDIDNLLIGDFSLTQLQGISSASITSITKISIYQYDVVVDVGSGNGTLQLNFNDRKTVKYAGVSTFISNYIGELSVEGELYNINKARPEAILTSGTNPYVIGNFLVTLRFSSPISSFNLNNIGLSNAIVVKYVLLDELTSTYQLEIKPLNKGVVIVKALEATGTTTALLTSKESNTLTRIFASYFPIVQLPLNISTGYNDVSPSNIQLNEIIPNNTLYSTTEPTFGESSVLSISAIDEQSGFTLTNYNALSGIVTPDTAKDWTIEFFLRINSTLAGTSKKAHIFSIQNGSGLAITANQGRLIVSRSPTQNADLFSSIIWKDRETTNYELWEAPGISVQDKFPHFALTKKGNIYRFYLNGKRVGIITSSNLFDITKGIFNLGYFPVSVTDVPYLLSNLRITYGKALYTAYSINVPYPPYPVSPNITEEAELLNYVSIYSNNSSNIVARNGDKVILNFSAIANLTVAPIVKINNIVVSVTKLEYNQYRAEWLVDSAIDGQLPFEIKVPLQNGIPEKLFTSTTDASFVVIDNAPVSVIVNTNETNNDAHQLDVDIELSEQVVSFTLDSITTNNCTVSNLYKYPQDNKYRVSCTATTTGTFSIAVNANKIVDLAGNFNIASNVLNRNAIVPVYVPDPYWSNVTLLLQPTTNIIEDLSSFNSTIDNFNTVVSSDSSPAGLTKSLYFDGYSSLNITGQALPVNNEYTIELFAYVSSKSSFRLNRPVLNPASNIQDRAFNLSWTSVPTSLAYVVDIATNSNFTKFVPGFKNKNIGSSNSTLIQSLTPGLTPSIKPIRFVGVNGFILEWDKDKSSEAYRVDVSTDNNFVNKLTSYNNRLTADKYIEVGDISNLKNVTNTTLPTNNTVIINNAINPVSSLIVTGLLKDGSNYPQLNYFLEESSIRLYRDTSYATPAIIEDVEILSWHHIAMVNRHRYTYLYYDGELVDKVKNVGLSSSIIMGQNIGFIKGYMTGVRITKGIARYTKPFIQVPSLPYPTS
jgi:hypothetical protein